MYVLVLFCLVEDEKELGVVFVDVGGGICNVVIYIEGMFVFVKVIVVGGDNIIFDIVYGFLMFLNYVECIKMLYGCVMV